MNTSGCENTATGVRALIANATGSINAELTVSFASHFQLTNAAFRCARAKRYPERDPIISQKTNITPRVRVTKARSTRAREGNGVLGAPSGTKRRNTTPGRTRNKSPESLANPD